MNDDNNGDYDDDDEGGVDIVEGFVNLLMILT